MRSYHVNNCNPDCANQENGGYGFVIGYKSLSKHLDIAIGRILLINSYGDSAAVNFIQLEKLEFEYKLLRSSLAIWLMDIYGYKDEDGRQKVVSPPPWPKFQIGINPVFPYTDSFFINYNLIYFPIVKIDWYSFSLLYKF
jgi:hypothetical protein